MVKLFVSAYNLSVEAHVHGPVRLLPPGGDAFVILPDAAELGVDVGRTTEHELLLALARESLAASKGTKIHYMLDYFDASINRLAAWVIGARDFRKALLIALLEPKDGAEAEKKLDYTARLAAQEAARTLPWGAVWQEFLDRSGVPDDFQVLQVLRDYEKRVLSRRN